jgi:pimeloyl-ACP methyl ester carboxylesterase
MQERRQEGISFVTGGWPLDDRKATLVFLHGSGGSNVLWHGQVDALAERVNTLAPDLPGHGRSGGLGMSSVAEYARAVQGWLRSLRVPGPIPCGLSLGGGIALQLLLDHDGEFKAGVLIGTGARLRVLPAILESIRSDYAGFVASTGTFAVSPKTDPERLRPLMESMGQCPAGTTLGDFLACNEFDVMDRLVSIRVPVLVVNGQDDRLTPPKYGTYLAQHIPHAEQVLLPDAGHLAPVERPEALNRTLEAFLDREGLCGTS